MTEEAMERSLLEVDGACRDINFSEYISATSAVALLDFIATHWELKQATNVDGEPVQPDEFRALLSTDKGALSTSWSGQIGPRHLQGYFYWPEPGRVFCELTFFPQDLAGHGFTLDGFLRLLAGLVNAAQSREYYVRFEDAAWSHREGADKSSVILSHESVALPRG